MAPDTACVIGVLGVILSVGIQPLLAQDPFGRKPSLVRKPQEGKCVEDDVKNTVHFTTLYREE